MAKVESPDRPGPPSRISASSSVAQTYKAHDVEGWLDLRFYRPVGFQLARFFALLGLSPSAVSLAGGAIGIVAGHFYLFPDLRWNLFGFALQTIANAFDNADGQLARLTNQGSLHGAVIDSMADHAVFFSVYLHLVLRALREGAPSSVWLLAAVAGASHLIQTVVADYFREAYLHFVARKPRMNLDSVAVAEQPDAPVSWRQPLRKLTLHLYLNHLRAQEFFVPKLRRLRLRAPNSRVAEEYRRDCRPLLKWNRLLATNCRMLLLLVSLLLARPLWFFWIEVTLLNLLLVFLLRAHDKIFARLLARTAESSRP